MKNKNISEKKFKKKVLCFKKMHVGIFDFSHRDFSWIWSLMCGTFITSGKNV